MSQKIIPFAILLLILNACALTVDTVDIEYKPDATAIALPGAKGIVVNLDVQDVRTSYQDRISTKKNGYGMEMASIVSTRDVRSMVIDAFQTELKARGFSVGKSAVSVQANIHKFYSDFKVGFFSGESVGEVTFSVQVQDSNSKPIHAKIYTGEGVVTGVMLMGGENAENSIELAFTTAVKKVMADENFIKSIMAAHAAASSSGAVEKKKTPNTVPTS
ncbi:MAG: hypothetical protein JKY20_09010 [Alphaproteobacteria bacterium]|nr:hypothetical protein [Alphaproteobacteria bacterium]